MLYQRLIDSISGAMMRIGHDHYNKWKKLYESGGNMKKGLPKEIEVGRYHSWVVDPNLPDVLKATSYDKNGQVMSLTHTEYDVCGVQYHPESVLTPDGKKILLLSLIILR